MTGRPRSVFLVLCTSQYLCGKSKAMAHTTDTPVNLGSLPGVMFSSMIPDVKILSDVNYQAAVTITIDGETAFSETLYANQDGIVLEDLTELVEPYARQHLVVQMQIMAVKQGGTTSSQTVTVLFCTCDMGDGVTASEFYTGYFLSTLRGPKLTAMGRLEYLSYYGTGTASVTATYADGSTRTFSAEATGGNDEYTRIDVSPSNYMDGEKEPVEYTVKSGSREQCFIVEPEQLDCAPILLFVNSFGVEELLYCTGLHQVSPEYKRSQTRIGRYTRTYKLEETRHFKADTGPLNRAMADWVDEVLRSEEIRVCNYYNGQVRPGKEVVITDSKSDRTNADDELPRITFTYQYSQKNHNVLQLYREGRIFDNTFDDTFN